jgi:hypothetical protein
MSNKSITGIMILFVLGMILLLMYSYHQMVRINERQDTVVVNTIQLAQEWAYFEGQKEAINGDVRIKYDPQTKKYSWTKNCWNGNAVKMIFDPSKSEDPMYFMTETNLTK